MYRLALLSLICVSCLGLLDAELENTLPFRPERLFADNNEACALGDINKDGLIDIVAGRNWYAAPDFCLLYTSPSPRDLSTSRMPSSA